MVRHLMRVQTAYGDDPEVVLVSFSVAPSVDTPEVLAEYAAANGIEAATWRLATGSRDRIYDLARSSYLADASVGGGPNDFLHTERVLLVDHDRHIRGVYQGTQAFEVSRLLEDIEILKRAGRRDAAVRPAGSPR